MRVRLVLLALLIAGGILFLWEGYHVEHSAEYNSITWPNIDEVLHHSDAILCLQVSDGTSDCWNLALKNLLFCHNCGFKAIYISAPSTSDKNLLEAATLGLTNIPVHIAEGHQSFSTLFEWVLEENPKTEYFFFSSDSQSLSTPLVAGNMLNLVQNGMDIVAGQFCHKGICGGCQTIFPFKSSIHLISNMTSRSIMLPVPDVSSDSALPVALCDGITPPFVARRRMLQAVVDSYNISSMLELSLLVKEKGLTLGVVPSYHVIPISTCQDDSPRPYLFSPFGSKIPRVSFSAWQQPQQIAQEVVDFTGDVVPLPADSSTAIASTLNARKTCHINPKRSKKTLYGWIAEKALAPPPALRHAVRLQESIEAANLLYSGSQQHHTLAVSSFGGWVSPFSQCMERVFLSAATEYVQMKSPRKLWQLSADFLRFRTPLDAIDPTVSFSKLSDVSHVHWRPTWPCPILKDSFSRMMPFNPVPPHVRSGELERVELVLAVSLGFGEAPYFHRMISLLEKLYEEDLNIRLNVWDFTADDDPSLSATLEKISASKVPVQYKRIPGPFSRAAGLNAAVAEFLIPERLRESMSSTRTGETMSRFPYSLSELARPRPPLEPHENKLMFFVDTSLMLPDSVVDDVRQYVVAGVSAYMPVVFKCVPPEAVAGRGLMEAEMMQPDCRSGYWNHAGYGVLGVRLSDFLAAGGFTTEFGSRWGGEDIDMAISLHDAGLLAVRPRPPGGDYVYWRVKSKKNPYFENPVAYKEEKHSSGKASHFVPPSVRLWPAPESPSYLPIVEVLYQTLFEEYSMELHAALRVRACNGTAYLVCALAPPAQRERVPVFSAARGAAGVTRGGWGWGWTLGLAAGASVESAGIGEDGVWASGVEAGALETKADAVLELVNQWQRGGGAYLRAQQGDVRSRDSYFKQLFGADAEASGLFLGPTGSYSGASHTTPMQLVILHDITAVRVINSGRQLHGQVA
eukprot:Rmarinus@m.3413